MSMECGAVWVRVSLSAYFSDERARCMMLVPGEGARRAGWLARRLRRTFRLPRRPALLCQGHLLPPAEPLPTRAPLLQLEAVPPSGRVVDVSRQRASDEDSDAPAPSPPFPPPRTTLPPAPSQETSQDEEEGGDLLSHSLDAMKRRALALLEGAGAERRRRRVRRRRPRPAPLSQASEAQPSEAQPEVLHNEEGSRRAPRHVRALSPPATAAAPRCPTPGGRDLFTS